MTVALVYIVSGFAILVVVGLFFDWLKMRKG